MTAAEARLAIPGWQDLSEVRRRGLASALTGAALIVKQDEAAMVLSCTALNAVLFTKPAAAHGLTSERFGRIVSDLRCIMRRLGLHAPDLRGRAALDPAWQAIHDLLSSEYRQAALVGFFGFCSLHHVAPAQVDDATLTAYEAWLRTDTLYDDAAGQARRTASNWTWAAGKVAGWPAGALRRPSMREQYTLPFDAYPASFGADVERFGARMACNDLDALFDDDLLVGADEATAAAAPAEPHKGSPRRGRRACAPRTVNTRLFHIRQAAAALGQAGIPPSELRSLRDLVHPVERVRTILAFFLARAEQRRTTQTGGIAETLRQIARYYVGLPEPDLDRIAKWIGRVTPPPRTKMADENMRRLRALLEPRNRARAAASARGAAGTGQEQQDHTQGGGAAGRRGGGVGYPAGVPNAQG